MTVATGRYQHCRPLTEDEYETLKADIHANGVLEYVHVDEDGNILVGHHRARAAGELGIEYPRHVVSGLSELQKHAYAVRLESLGRAKDSDTKRWTAIDLWGMRKELKLTQESIGALIGVKRSTVYGWLKEWDAARKKAEDEQKKAEQSSNPALDLRTEMTETVSNTRGQQRPTRYKTGKNGAVAPPAPPAATAVPDEIEEEEEMQPGVYPGRWVDPTRPEPENLGDIEKRDPTPFDDTGLVALEASRKRQKIATYLRAELLRVVQGYEPEIMVEGARPEDLPHIAGHLDVSINWLIRARDLARDPRALIRRMS